MSASTEPSSAPITGRFARASLDVLAESIPVNLPAQPGQIVGREKEIRLIRKFLEQDDVRLVTLTGFGGAGKTTLALWAAYAMLEHFRGGLFFIDLSTITDPALILPAIAQTLNLQEEAQRPLADTLRDFLANRAILFVLDNFEQVIHGAPVVAAFLEANPQVCLLVTSREALRLRAEQVVPVLPLAQGDAVQLFVQRVQAINPDFRLDEQTSSAIAELCARLDGLPLALELAAMRTRMFSPQAMLSRFRPDPGPESAALDLLSAGARDLPSRQQTLRNAIDWSYSLLTLLERGVLRVAALFPAGFEIQPLGCVAGLPEKETMEAVALLVDKHLVQPMPGEAPRFVMLDTLREFGREQSRQSGEWEQAVRAFVFCFRRLAGQLAAEIEGGDAAAAMARLDLEHANLLTAMDQALDSSDADAFAAGIHLMDGLEQYWFQRGYFSEAGKYIDSALQLEAGWKQTDVQLFAILHGLKGTLQWARHDFTGAARHHETAIEYCKQAGDERRLARALNNLAVNLDGLQEFERASEFYEQGLALSQKAGDVWNQLRILCNMGIRYHHLLGDDDRAEACWQSALALSRQQGRHYETVSIEFNQACLWFARQELDRAADLLEHVVRTGSEWDFPQIEAFGRGLQGLVRLQQKDLAAASAMLLEALELSHGLGDTALTYELFECAAGVCLVQKRHEQAAILLAGAEAHTPKQQFLRVLPLWTGFEKAVVSLRAALGLQAFQRAWEHGTRESYEGLYALAYQACCRDAVKKAVDGQLALLTERELDTLRLLAQGKTNQQISQELFVTLKTVEKHVANILRKLGVKNRTEAVAWAIGQGLIPHGEV